MTTKKIKTSDILGDNYYIYELTSSNYTPALNDTITITCTMKDVYDAAASGKSITLYQNGTSKGTQTTNSSGMATWSITCSTAGLQKFSIKDTNIEVFVDNKEDKTNKVISWGQTPSNDNYPSEKLVKDSLDNVLENFRTKTITSTFPIIHTREYEDNGVTHTTTVYDGGVGHWELTINLASLNNGRLALMNPVHYVGMEIIVDDGTLAIADPNGNIYLDGDTLPNETETTATGTSGNDMPVTIPYENVVINLKNNGEDILITFSQANTTIYSMTLHQNENWKFDVVYVNIFDNPNYTITGVSKHNVPNYYTETNYTFTNPKRYEDNDVIIPIYDFSIVEYTVDFTYDDVDWNSNEVSWLRFDSNSDHNQIYVINNKIYRINQDPPSSVESNEEWVEWIELNCPMLCQGTQITFKRYFLDGCVMTEWNDSNITVKSDDWYSYITNYNEPVPASFRSYDGIDSVNVTVRRFKKALPTLVSDFEDANQYEKISNKSSSITTDTGSTSKYPTIKAIEDYAQHLLNTVTLSTNKQEVDAGESFIITANVKDNNGNPIANKNLTLMQQYDTYSNPDMWATGWVKDEGFYVNDTTFKGDWSCRFEVNSTRDHTGLQLYTSSEQRILFSTLGAYVTSNIKITCTNNIITINVDGTDYGTTYTQNSNGTKVGFFTHEDYSVNIKNFVVNNAMLYKDCGSQTTDSNGNCSWSFNDGLSQGLYHFYVNNTNLDIFVDALIDHEKYKTFPTTVTQTIFNTYNGTWLTPINVPNDAIIKFTLTTNSISSMVGEYLIYMGEIDSLTSTAFYIGIINSKFTIGLGCSGDEYYPPIPDDLSNGAEIGFKIDEIEITDDFGENTGHHEYDISFTYFIDDAEYHHTFSTEIPNEYLPIDWNRIIAAQTGGVVITKLRLERPLMSDGIYDNSPQLVTSNTIFDELSNNWFKKKENIVHEIESNTDEWSNFNGDWIVEGSTVTFIAGENGHIKFGGTLGVNNEIEINIENYTDITITDYLSGDEWSWHPNDAGTRNVFTITLPTYTLTTINGSPGYTWNINLTCNSDSQSYSTGHTNMIDDSAVFNNNEKATMLERNHLSEVQGDIKRIEYTKSYKSYHPENNNFNLITSDGVYHAIDAFFDTIYPIDSTYITTNPGTDPNDILRGGWTVEDTFTADSNEYAIWRRVG